MPPAGPWAKLNRSVIWGAGVFVNFAWISVAVYFFFFFDPKQWLPSTPLRYWWLPLAIAVGFGALYFVFLKTVGYLGTCWKQYRYRFVPDGFFATEAFLLLRVTEKTPRDEMIGVRAEGDRVYLDRVSTGLSAQAQNAEEARWLAYEIDQFYRTHPGKESQSYMDRIIDGVVPALPVVCPACKKRYELTGETFRCGEPIGCRHCLKRIPLLVDLEEKRERDNPFHGLEKYFATKTNCRVAVQGETLVIRSRLVRGGAVFRDVGVLACCCILFVILCVMPFGALNEIGFFSFPFWKLPLVTWWTFFLYVLCVPLWLVFLSLVRWQVYEILIDLLMTWKIVLGPDGIEYSFGIFRRTVRRIPLAIGLHAAPRNSYRLRQSLIQPRRWDHQNPATDQKFAVVLRVGDRYFGEIPCRNTAEVDKISSLIEDFLAGRPKVELSEEDRTALLPDPEIMLDNVEDQ